MLREIPQDVIQRGFKTGGLVRLSNRGSTHFSIPVAATKSLWRTLLWPYPSAQATDVIDVDKLIDELQEQFVFELGRPRKEAIVISHSPRSKPAWLPDSLSIGVSLSTPDSLLLFLKDDGPSFVTDSTALPASLLLKVLSLTTRLYCVARRNDYSPLANLRYAVVDLVKSHPLASLIRDAHTYARMSRALPSHLRAEDYRTLLLDELARQLELLSACGLALNRFIALAKHFDTLRTPLNELLHLTRSLVLLGAGVPKHAFQFSPFDDLLSHYATLRGFVGQTNPAIPNRLIKQLRLHAYSLSQLVPDDLSDELRAIEQALAVLDSLSDAFAMGATYPPTYRIFH